MLGPCNTTVNIEQKWMKRKPMCTMRMLKDGSVDGVIREMLKARGSLLMYRLPFDQVASLFVQTASLFDNWKNNIAPQY